MPPRKIPIRRGRCPHRPALSVRRLFRRFVCPLVCHCERLYGARQSVSFAVPFTFCRENGSPRSAFASLAMTPPLLASDYPTKIRDEPIKEDKEIKNTRKAYLLSAEPTRKCANGARMSGSPVFPDTAGNNENKGGKRSAPRRMCIGIRSLSAIKDTRCTGRRAHSPP